MSADRAGAKAPVTTRTGGQVDEWEEIPAEMAIRREERQKEADDIRQRRDERKRQKESEAGWKKGLQVRNALEIKFISWVYKS